MPSIQFAPLLGAAATAAAAAPSEADAAGREEPRSNEDQHPSRFSNLSISPPLDRHNFRAFFDLSDLLGPFGGERVSGEGSGRERERDEDNAAATSPPASPPLTETPAEDDCSSQPAISRDASSDWSASNVRHRRFPAMDFSHLVRRAAAEATPRASPGPSTFARRFRPASLDDFAAGGSPVGGGGNAAAQWSPTGFEVPFSSMATPAGAGGAEGMRAEQPSWGQYLLRPIRLIRALTSPTAPQGLRYCATMDQPGASPSGSPAPLLRAPLPDGRESLCAICTEPFLPGESVQPMVDCIHLFHASCIQGHIRARCDGCSPRAALEVVVLCPLCRGPLLARSEEQIPEEERGFAAPLQVEEPPPSQIETPSSTRSVVYTNIFALSRAFYPREQ